MASSAGGVHNAWIGEKGPAALDLRSDTMTTPTASMLEAVKTCTLRDDVFQEDPNTNDLEAYVASITGKEAALFVLSGTQGNQVGLRSQLSQPPYSVLCDHRSHIVNYEAGGIASLAGALVTTVIPQNGIHLTLEDVKKHVRLGSDVHQCPTRIISLENTLNGMIMPLSEIQRIATFTREHNIKLHCDGARLWEACAAGAGTLPEMCSSFDTVSLCFSKGLGAPVGSILVGSADTIKQARWVRKFLGGGLRQPGMLTAAARVAVEETFGKTPDGSDGWLRRSHEVAKEVEKLWTGMGGKLVHPVQTNMAWIDVEATGCSNADFVALCAEQGLAVFSGRLVTHYQIAQNREVVLEKLETVFKRVFEQASLQGASAQEKAGQSSMYKSE